MEHVFRTMELEGVFLPSRIDYLLSMATFLLEFLVCPSDSERRNMESELLAGGLRMKKTDPNQDAHPDYRKNKTTELFFSTLMAVYGSQKQSVDHKGTIKK